MPKTTSAGMDGHLAQKLTTLATCWKITRKDATVFAFTDHDRDLTISAVTYKAALSYSRSALRGASDMSTDQVETNGIIDDASITDADLVAGLFDFAALQIILVNWADVTMTPIMLKSGNLGRISPAQNQYTAELLGLTDRLQRIVGRVCQPTCRRQLGDTGCTVDLPTLAQTGTVATVSSGRKFTATGLTGAGPVTIAYTATTIHFEKKSSILDSASGLVSAGFAVNDAVDVTGSMQNDRTHTIAALAAGKITTASQTVLKEAAGNSITLTTKRPGYFDFGVVTWLTGTNAGLKIEVREWDGTSQLILKMPMPYAIQVGDTFSIVPGCDKRMQTCADKFAGVAKQGGGVTEAAAKMDGEPFVPGQDAGLTYADAQ